MRLGAFLEVRCIMLKLIFTRILEAIPTLFILITVSFFLLRFAPGNPFSSEKTLPPEVMQNINEKYGLDKPLFEQYIGYLSNILRGDLGPSFKYKDYTVNELVSKALPVSAKVGFYAFIFTVLVGDFETMLSYCSIMLVFNRFIIHVVNHILLVNLRFVGM